VDEKRIYLTGLSMGGYGAWELAMRQPTRFAALAPICGGGDESQAAILKDIPVWAWHGDADPAVPVERSRRMIEAIKTAGGKPRYSELPGVGHDSWTPAYTRADGVVPWLFEQVKK
jgi:predicted peptidase